MAPKEEAPVAAVALATPSPAVAPATRTTRGTRKRAVTVELGEEEEDTKRAKKVRICFSLKFRTFDCLSFCICISFRFLKSIDIYMLFLKF